MNNYHKTPVSECESNKKSPKCVISWILFIILAVVFLGFTCNFICASRQSTDAMRYIDSTCQSLLYYCPDTSKCSSVGVVSCSCRATAITDTAELRKKLEGLDKCADNAFNTNVLTFLVSFSLIAILTLLLNDSDKMHSLYDNFRDKTADKIDKMFDEYSQAIDEKVNNIQQTLDDRMKKLDEFQHSLERERRNYRYALFAQSIQNDCVAFASTIISSNYVNNILPAIESTRSRIMSFNDDIQFYSKRTREEGIFTTDEIVELTKPLYFAEGQIEDMISGARVYFNGHYKTEPSKLQHISIFERDISPLRDDIHSLIEKFESHLNAPQNREG